MIPKEAIEKAIEGGWMPGAWWPKVTERLSGNLEAQALAALMPSFWQALMPDKEWDNCGDEPDWLYNALCFHRLILTGGDTDAFWKELL